MKRSSIQQLKMLTSHTSRVQDGVNSDIGLASVPKEMEDNAMTKDMIGVHGNSRQPKRVHLCSGAHGTETFLSWASWTFVALDPGEVLWDTGAQEGIVGEQQLDQWCKLLAEYGLQVEWSQEKP